MKKYELTNETIKYRGKNLYRIKALIDFGNVKKGTRGGFIEKEENLSVSGNAFVYGDAKVCDDARVSGNAQVSGNALVCGCAFVYGAAKVCDDALVCDNALVYGAAKVCDNAQVSGNAKVCDNARVSGNARVYGDAQVSGNAKVCDNAQVRDNAQVCDDALVDKSINYAVINGFGTCCRPTTFFRCQDKTVKVSCGCFLGTIDEFRNQVKNTRGGKIAKEYLMIADLMEMHFCEAEDEYDD